MLTKSNSIHLCRGWERQTQPSSTADSETQHELQPPLNLQLRTGQQASSPHPPTQLESGRFYTFAFVNIDSICNIVCCHTKLNWQAKCVYFLTHCPLLPADGGTWQSPFPSEFWYPVVYCTLYSDPPCQLGVASVELLNWQLLPVFGLAGIYNVLQFQPEYLLKAFSTANEKKRGTLFKRVPFCVKIEFWLKSLSVSIFMHVTVY